MYNMKLSDEFVRNILNLQDNPNDKNCQEFKNLKSKIDEYEEFWNKMNVLYDLWKNGKLNNVLFGCEVREILESIKDGEGK